MSPEIIKIAANAGALALVVCVVIFACFAVATKLGPSLIKAKQEQNNALVEQLAKFASQLVQAQKDQAEAMGEQAACLREVKQSVTEFVGRENNDHSEIKIGLQVLINEIRDMRNVMDNKSAPEIPPKMRGIG